MGIVIALLAITLVIVGIIFSVLPPLPGPLFSYLALVAAHFVPDITVSTTAFVVWGLLTVAILAADYVIPIAATKKFGGTKAGVWGGAIGAIAGMFIPIPFGIIWGPLVGAIIGDLIGGNHYRAAMKSGFGSFIGFLVATSMKVIMSVIMGVVVAIKVVTYLGEGLRGLM